MTPYFQRRTAAAIEIKIQKLISSNVLQKNAEVMTCTPKENAHFQELI